MKPELMTKKEAAEFLGVSVKTIERLIASGKLQAVKILRSVRIRVSDLKVICELGAK